MSAITCYIPLMSVTSHASHASHRFIAAMCGVGLLLISCSGGDGESTTVAGATSAQAADTSLPADQPGSSETGAIGQCATVGDNLSYDELNTFPFIGLSGDPELFRDVIAATPAGGHQKFLNDYCAITVAAYGADDPVSVNVIEGIGTSAEVRVSALVDAYASCLEIPANRSPSETFEPDLPGTAPVVEGFRIANEDLCPQVAFPAFPS